jgi:hypothetical protein
MPFVGGHMQTNTRQTMQPNATAPFHAQLRWIWLSSAREGEKTESLQMNSVMLSSFTMAALFERLCGSYRLVENHNDFLSDELGGALHLGRGLNVDEIYSIASDLSLTTVPDKKKSAAGAGSQVNEHAGNFNRALQFGESSHVTKTSGAYGQTADKPTSWMLLSNMHPEMGVPMERGDIGNHTGCLKERLWLFGARRVQPHEEISVHYTLPHGVSRWAWVDLDLELAAMSGLSDR